MTCSVEALKHSGFVARAILLGGALPGRLQEFADKEIRDGRFVTPVAKTATVAIGRKSHVDHRMMVR